MFIHGNVYCMPTQCSRPVPGNVGLEGRKTEPVGLKHPQKQVALNFVLPSAVGTQRNL